MSGLTDSGTAWEARYSVPKSEFTAATLRDSLEGEVRRSHGRYGDFSFSRWVHEAGG